MNVLELFQIRFGLFDFLLQEVLFLPPQFDRCRIELESLVDLPQLGVNVFRAILDLPEGFIEFRGIALKFDCNALNISRHLFAL